MVFGRNLQEIMLSLSKHDLLIISALMNQLERRSLVSPSLATVDNAIALAFYLYLPNTYAACR